MTHPYPTLRSCLIWLSGILCLTGNAAIAQNVIRGATPGWPGNTGYYAPQNVYQFAPNGAAPVVQAQYAPQYAAPAYAAQPGYTAYYAPAAAARTAYAVPAAGSYSVSYAGANQPGLATTPYYGSFSPPVQRVAYYAAPQQVYYRAVAVAPVQYYRPVIAYQPAVGGPAVAVPQTCGYAATCQPSCQTSSCQQKSCWSPWRPFAWLWGNNSCNQASTCCKPPCGQPAAVPYYTTPVIPTAPAPGAVYPTTPFNSTIVTPGVSGGRIPPPATRAPGAGGNFGAPADSAPRLGPGTVIPSNPAPGSTNPGIPGINIPGAFPGGSPGPAPFTPPPTTEYRPIVPDPYSNPAPSNPALGNPALSNPAPSNAETPLMLQPPPPTSPIRGSGFSTDRTNLDMLPSSPRTISEPGLNPPASVQPLSDPDAELRNRNRAPQLINPSDRTAATNNRWAVIPAVWPTNSANVQPVSERTNPAVATPAPLAPVVAPAQLDDGGWKSAK